MKRYDKYKPSGIDWIGDVPEHWEVKRGKFCTKLISGFPFDSGKFSYDENDMPLIRIRDIMNGQTEAYYNGSYPEEAVVKKGELLIGMDGDFNIARWSGRDGLLNQRVCKLVSTKELDEDYAFYLLERPLKCINDVTYATTVKHLSTFDIYEAFLPVPPLAEQEAISAYLDARCADIDKVVATQQKRIALLQELKQSEITQAVTRGLNPDARMKDSGVEWIGMVPEHWEVKKLRFLGSTKNGISKGGDYFGKGYPFVSYGDVYKNYALPTMVDGLVESSDEERNDFSVEKGDVFFTRTSETIEEVGFSSVCAKTIKDAVFAGFVIRFRPQKGVLNVGYSKYYFRCDLHRAFFVKEMNLVTRASLSQELLKNLIVLLPPFDEQAAIAEYLDRRCGEIDKQIGAVTKQIDLLREYKQALITEVVTGKFRV
jgi:type I restriction enzyme S subunit